MNVQRGMQGRNGVLVDWGGFWRRALLAPDMKFDEAFVVGDYVPYPQLMDFARAASRVEERSDPRAVPEIEGAVGNLCHF